MKSEMILSIDLGTGGVKVCLFSPTGYILDYAFKEYPTYFPVHGFQEQKPLDWWNAIVFSVSDLIKRHPEYAASIGAIGVSGHSLGVVALGYDGTLISEYTPIWSDNRAEEQAGRFFTRIGRDNWYLETGAGFPPELYSLFKIMWYKDHMTDLYHSSRQFIGSKDYINFKLTGCIATDHSYASGSGAYKLSTHTYEDGWLDAAEIDKNKLPKILGSSEVLGLLNSEAAKALGLKAGIPVVCGGVDNACMALGAGCFTNGGVYTSLGTSAWIAVSSSNPIVDLRTRPYVFEHCVPNQYVSATCIFSAGGSFRWVRDNLCQSLKAKAESENVDAYDLMTALASQSPVGANKLLFNPSLSGGSSLDKTSLMRGSFVGLDISHKLGDIIRASMEGVALNLRIALDALREHVSILDTMLIVGGGVKSALWRQIFADCYNKTIIQSTVGQDAGALGAAALAANGAGIADGFQMIANSHTVKSVTHPHDVDKYNRLLAIYKQVNDALAPIYKGLE